MTYEGIEFAIRAGLGQNDWVATIHFPDTNEPLARSSMVKVTGTREEAIALTQDRIHNWWKRRRAPPAKSHSNERHFLPQRELVLRGPIRGLSAAAQRSGLRSTPRRGPTDVQSWCILTSLARSADSASRT